MARIQKLTQKQSAALRTIIETALAMEHFAERGLPLAKGAWEIFNCLRVFEGPAASYVSMERFTIEDVVAYIKQAAAKDPARCFDVTVLKRPCNVGADART